MSIVKSPEHQVIPKFDPVTHPIEYAALVPPNERPFHSYNSMSGRPPTAGELACMRAHFGRYKYSRIESKTYENGLRIACFWQDDGVSEAQEHFDAQNKANSKGVDDVAI